MIFSSSWLPSNVNTFDKYCVYLYFLWYFTLGILVHVKNKNIFYFHYFFKISSTRVSLYSIWNVYFQLLYLKVLPIHYQIYCSTSYLLKYKLNAKAIQLFLIAGHVDLLLQKVEIYYLVQKLTLINLFLNFSTQLVKYF